MKTTNHYRRQLDVMNNSVLSDIKKLIKDYTKENKLQMSYASSQYKQTLRSIYIMDDDVYVDAVDWGSEQVNAVELSMYGINVKIDVLSEIRIALQETVFAVIKTAVIDGDEKITTRIFRNRMDAQDAFNETVGDIKAFNPLYDEDSVAFPNFIDTDNHFMIWQSGAYSICHTSVTLNEIELE